MHFDKHLKQILSQTFFNYSSKDILMMDACIMSFLKFNLCTFICQAIFVIAFKVNVIQLCFFIDTLNPLK